MSTQKSASLIGLDNELKMLTTINRFLFLRAQEAAKLIWPEKPLKNSIDSAHSTLRKLQRKNLITKRILPDNAGYAYTLNKNGANFLKYHTNNNELPAKSREKWGKSIAIDGISKWLPPKTWKHHLLSTSILAEFTYKHPQNKSLDSNYSVYSELEFRHYYKDKIKSGLIRKIPDGVIVDNERKIAHLLETELSNKFGDNMLNLVESIILPELSAVFGMKISNTIIGFDIYQTTKGNHSLNHQEHIISAVSRKLAQINKHQATYYLFKAELSGRSVFDYEYIKTYTQRDDLKLITQQRQNRFNELLQYIKIDWEEFESSMVNQRFRYRTWVEFEDGYYVYRFFKLVDDPVNHQYCNKIDEIEIKNTSGKHKDKIKAIATAERKLCELCISTNKAIEIVTDLELILKTT